MTLFIGTAGWNLRREFADEFSGSGTHLERYAERFNAVEINSSFYRPHRISTYRRWADATPENFRFAVKLPKQITHVNRLKDVETLAEIFATETAGLGGKLGCVLVQLPPSLAFDESLSDQFFSNIRQLVIGQIVCEPRHLSWFHDSADSLLAKHEIARVAADPSIVADAANPGGCRRTCYFRWHGSPRMYYSSYDETQLDKLSNQIVTADRCTDNVWCIFDNTAEGSALKNALDLVSRVGL